MKSILFWFQRIQFSPKLRVRILRKISRFLENSIPLSQALKVIYVHATHEGKKSNVVEAVALINGIKQYVMENLLDKQ